MLQDNTVKAYIDTRACYDSDMLSSSGLVSVDKTLKAGLIM